MIGTGMMRNEKVLLDLHTPPARPRRKETVISIVPFCSFAEPYNLRPNLSRPHHRLTPKLMIIPGPLSLELEGALVISLGELAGRARTPPAAMDTQSQSSALSTTCVTDLQSLVVIFENA